MKKEEYDILGIKKLKEGKSYNQIRKEINELDSTCKETKIDKKIIIEQDKKIIKLKEKIKKQQNKIFNLELGKTYSKKEEITLTNIKKIVCLIKTEKQLTEKQLKELTNLNKISTVLSFLKRNNVIKEKIIKGKKHYIK